MKIERPQGGAAPQGSFGIPPQIQAAAEEAKARAHAHQDADAEATQEEAAEPAMEAKDQAEAEARPPTPTELLKSIGVTFDDKDFHQLLFKGFIEKELAVIPALDQGNGKKIEFRAKIKTLTGDEYDVVDELLATDVESVKMTQEGFKSRRAMWILSLAVLEVNGKALLSKLPLNEDKTPNLHDIAKQRRKILNGMSPFVVNHMIQKQGALTVAVEMISANPSSSLKNS